MDPCDCGCSSRNSSIFVVGLVLGGVVGFVGGAMLSPSRREMKKVVRRTANSLSDAMDSLKESISYYTG